MVPPFAASNRPRRSCVAPRYLVDLFAESGVFLLQSLLGPLTVLYIGTRDVPPHDLSLVVSKRVGTNQEPAIGSVAAAQAHSTSLAAPLINERSIYALTLSKSSGCTSGTLFL